jgi:hypothetical protein
MYYISLGRKCPVAFNLRRYRNFDTPSQFFDWARTDFKCILHILNLNSIDTIFNIENMILDKELYKHENDLTITFTNFVKDNLCLMYHHDINMTYSDDVEMNARLIDFCDKYKRRYNRLKELIISDKKLCFIYYITNDFICNFDYNDVDLFDKLLKAINPNINYTLVLLVEEEEKYIYEKNKNCLKINLTPFMDVNTVEWSNDHYDWKNIFELIEKIINNS